MPESLISVITSRVFIDTTLSRFAGVATTSRFTSLQAGSNAVSSVTKNNMLVAVRICKLADFLLRKQIP